MAVQGHEGRKVHMRLFISDQEFTISTCTILVLSCIVSKQCRFSTENSHPPL